MCMGGSDNSSAISIAKDNLQSVKLNKLKAAIDSDVATDAQKEEYAKLTKTKQ